MRTHASPTRLRVLVVAASIELRAALAQALASVGYAVELAEGAARARDLAAAGQVKLAVVAPDELSESGLKLAHELGRSIGKLVIIAGGADQAAGIDAAALGADGVVVDGFDRDVFLREVERTLRTLAESAGDDAGERNLLQFDGLTLDLAGHAVLGREGSELPLTPSELSLLAVFAERPGRALSRDQLRAAMDGGDLAAYDRSIDMLVGRLRRKIERDPKKPALILTVPGVGYKFGFKPTATRASEETAPKLPEAGPALAGRPSLAVLPFQNLTGDPAEDYFTDGVVEEITTAIARMPWLFVIARNSSFTYKDKAIDIRRAAGELGARYVLEGSVRKAGGRVRITGQLIDSTSGAHIWADRFDGPVDDIFELQDQVASRVVGAIEPRLRIVEMRRAGRKPTGTLDAYDLFLRAAKAFSARTVESLREAVELLHRALAIEPDYSPAAGLLAWCRMFQTTITTLPPEELLEGARYARQVVEARYPDVDALWMGGWATAVLIGDSAAALSALERALALNPNSAYAWNFYGWLQAFRGEAEAAIEAIQQAMRLSPIDPERALFFGGLSFAHLVAGRYAEALQWVDKALYEKGNDLPVLGFKVAICGYLGQLDEGAECAGRLRRLRPGATIRGYRAAMGRYVSPEPLAIYLDGLRRAGLPEE